MDSPSRCAAVDAPLSGGASTWTRPAQSRAGAHGSVRARSRDGARRTRTGWSTLARSSRGTRSSLVGSDLDKAGRPARSEASDVAAAAESRCDFGFSPRSGASQCASASLEYKPIVAYIGRLDNQKGVHLIDHAIFYALAQGAEFMLLGSSPAPGDQWPRWHLKHYLNDHPDVHLELQFSPELAHLVYAGADCW